MAADLAERLGDDRDSQRAVNKQMTADNAAHRSAWGGAARLVRGLSTNGAED